MPTATTNNNAQLNKNAIFTASSERYHQIWHEISICEPFPFRCVNVFWFRSTGKRFNWKLHSGWYNQPDIHTYCLIYCCWACGLTVWRYWSWAKAFFVSFFDSEMRLHSQALNYKSKLVDFVSQLISVWFFPKNVFTVLKMFIWFILEFPWLFCR